MAIAETEEIEFELKMSKNLDISCRAIFRNVSWLKCKLSCHSADGLFFISTLLYAPFNYMVYLRDETLKVFHITWVHARSIKIMRIEITHDWIPALPKTPEKSQIFAMTLAQTFASTRNAVERDVWKKNWFWNWQPCYSYRRCSKIHCRKKGLQGIAHAKFWQSSGVLTVRKISQCSFSMEPLILSRTMGPVYTQNSIYPWA